MGVHDNHRVRKKQQFLDHGLDSFADHEVLELLLYYIIPRRDTNPVGHALMDRFGSLHRVFSAPAEELAEVSGMGPASAGFLKLVTDIYRKSRESLLADEQILDTPTAICEYCDRAFEPVEERVHLLCLDSGCRVLHTYDMGHGELQYSSRFVRALTENILSCDASVAVTVHVCTTRGRASVVSDNQLVSFLSRDLAMLDVLLLDHILVLPGGSISVRQKTRNMGFYSGIRGADTDGLFP